MAVVFPREGNDHWPLPPDYDSLTEDGQRQARVNAASIKGTPDLEVAGWEYFRKTYLQPEDSGWYKAGFVPSPPTHSQWVRDWYTYPRLVMACPRGTCKSTITLEDILRKLLTERNWECVLFQSTKEFCSSRLGQVMSQIEDNPLILRDFGKLRPKRGHGVWARGSVLETNTRCKLSAKPIMGSSLGTRPSGLLVLDDVEKSKDLVAKPSDLRQGFHDFFFNALLPMARSPAGMTPMRVIGTLYDRQMFIYWLYSTDDDRVKQYFHRTLMDIYDLDWDAMGEGWIEGEKARLGPAAFSAQCLNQPTTEDEAILNIHPELTTYYLDNRDEALKSSPFKTEAQIVTHQVSQVEQKRSNNDDSVEVVYHTRKISRPFSDVVSNMYRFITVDYAPTTSEMSDFSAVHVMGLESSDEHPNTLYSLDAWMGKVHRHALVRIMADMALRWRVSIVGVEAYGLQMEAFERFQLDMGPALEAECNKYGVDHMPAVIPLKFPTTISKGEKIKGMAWRFEQFRVKIPSDRGEEPAYRALWYQIANFTSDMGLLRNDDILDTLAMHQRIGKQTPAAGISVVPDTISGRVMSGELEDEAGHSHVESLIASGQLTDEMWEAIIREREEQENRENYWEESVYDWL